MRLRTLIVAGLATVTTGTALAPRVLTAQDRGAAALGDLVRGLGVNMRVLVIAAHPDDEDTQLITWLARGRQVETAYLSLTRGDGGQNLIGNELGEGLGVIRTEELLAARRVDGGHQYFTRAYDFGFSKTAEETYQHWPKADVLGDVVKVVRSFRPHVIVAVFSGTPRDGHGHHQVSGLLAREVYDASADTARWPAGAYGSAWTVQKFYRFARFSPEQATMQINVGEYNALLGRSYTELAGESRSQHKSQGFGQVQRKGVFWDYLRREASRVNEGTPAAQEGSLFDGIDTTWVRFRGVATSAAERAAVDSMPAAVNAARAALNLSAPTAATPALARVLRLVRAGRAAGACPPAVVLSPFDSLRSLRAGIAKDLLLAGCTPARADLASALSINEARAAQALALAAGVAIEVTADRELVATTDSVSVGVVVFNRGTVPVSVLRGSVLTSREQSLVMLVRPVRDSGLAPDIVVAPDSAARFGVAVRPPAPGSPWWLRAPRVGDLFAPALPLPGERAPNGVGGVAVAEDSRATSRISITLRIAGEEVPLTVGPIVYRFADPVKGEQNRPLAGVNAVTITLESLLQYTRANEPIDRTVRVTLRSASLAPREIALVVTPPRGLVADSALRTITLAAKETRDIQVRLRGRLGAGRHEVTLRATDAATGAVYANGYTTIEYDHIHPQRLFRDATLALQAVDVKVPASLSVAYVQGVGDVGAGVLRQLDVPVTLLDPASLGTADLSKYTTVVVGPRAYESSPELAAQNARLMEFAKKGGTVVVQYGQYEMARPGMLPYPIALGRPAARVTIEGAPVTILDPAHPLLNGPNKIVASDFEGWVQERSLYMPGSFDPQWTPLLEMHDPNEPENKGALLVAPYGQGTWVYVTLSLFRQLPAGVPGAARLIANLLAAGQRTGTTP